MTLPFASGERDNFRKNWLERYLRVQIVYDRRIGEELRAAAEAAEEKILELSGKPGVGAAARRNQLLKSRSAIRAILRTLYGNIKIRIEEGQGDAAESAVEAAIRDDGRILALLFPNKKQRTNFEASLKQSAKRNVQSMMTRVLKTERPLSRRVYHSEALANDSIGRLVNIGLSRGDSAADIAKAVRDHIRPDVPGGVGYAARRLGRTEINNAFHAQSVAQNQDRPWVDHVKWKLSKSHKGNPGDPCERYARQGSFPKESVPPKPHPNCLCYVIPSIIDYATFEQNLLLGIYDGWIDDNLRK